MDYGKLGINTFEIINKHNILKLQINTFKSVDYGKLEINTFEIINKYF